MLESIGGERHRVIRGKVSIGQVKGGACEEGARVFLGVLLPGGGGFFLGGVLQKKKVFFFIILF